MIGVRDREVPHIWGDEGKWALGIWKANEVCEGGMKGEMMMSAHNTVPISPRGKSTYLL